MIIEEDKAFKALDPVKIKKLKKIFDEIDHDNKKSIDFDKSLRFNKYIVKFILFYLFYDYSMVTIFLNLNLK
jgi:hypothetical protein